MDKFITYEMLLSFTTLTTIVFMVVEFIKEVPVVRNLRTKYLSWIIAFILITVSNMVVGGFVITDLLLYCLSAISISLTANGLHDFNKKVVYEKDLKIKDE